MLLQHAKPVADKNALLSSCLSEASCAGSVGRTDRCQLLSSCLSETSCAGSADRTDRCRVIRPGISRLGIASCSTLLGFCSTILIVRTCGPAAFGGYFFVLWLATVAASAIGVGMSTLTRRYAAEIQSRETPRQAAGVFYFVWQRQYRKILLYCLVYLVLVLPCSWFFGNNAPVWLLLLAGLSVPPLLLSAVASMALRSLRRFDLLANIQLEGVLTTLLLVMLVIQVQHDSIALLLLAAAAASMFVLTLALICVVRLLPLREALSPGQLLKERLARGLNNSLLLFTLDAIVWQPSELILLGHWRSIADLGFYALSSMISAGIMRTIPALLSTCILPLILRYIPDQHYMSAAEAYSKTTRSMALLAFPICALAILFCPIAIVFCFGAAGLPIVTPLRILLVSAAFGSVASVSLTYLANGNGGHKGSSPIDRAQLWSSSIAAVLNVALAPPFIALWGVTGAALACAMAQTASALGSIVICRRLITRNF